MQTTIYSGCAYPYEYEMLDQLHITQPKTGRVYEKQLQIGRIVWFSDVDECDENDCTVTCEISDSGILYWLCDNIHATNRLLHELDRIKENGLTPDYIGHDALQYITKSED